MNCIETVIHDALACYSTFSMFVAIRNQIQHKNNGNAEKPAKQFNCLWTFAKTARFAVAFWIKWWVSSTLRAFKWTFYGKMEMDDFCFAFLLKEQLNGDLETMTFIFMFQWVFGQMENTLHQLNFNKAKAIKHNSMKMSKTYQIPINELKIGKFKNVFWFNKIG